MLRSTDTGWSSQGISPLACLVNVMPSDKPQDAYAVIAQESMNDIPERLQPYWDRKRLSVV